jgi:hypothetical protein
MARIGRARSTAPSPKSKGGDMVEPIMRVSDPNLPSTVAQVSCLYHPGGRPRPNGPKPAKPEPNRIR